MKDIESAIQEETRSQQKSPAAVTHLLLDNKFKSACVKGLTDFLNLEVLSISGCGLSSLEGFPSLPKLTKLLLSDNRITSGLEHLTGLSSLTKLDLSGNRINSLQEIGKLKGLKIKSLDVLNCPVENTPDFKEKIFEMLSELEYLDRVDKNGVECDGDDDDEDEEENDADDKYDEEGGAEDDGEDDEDDEDEDEDGVQLPEDEDEDEDAGDDEAEHEEDAEDEDEDGEPGPGKRKRDGDDDAGRDDDDEEEGEEED